MKNKQNKFFNLLNPSRFSKEVWIEIMQTWYSLYFFLAYFSKKVQLLWQLQTEMGSSMGSYMMVAYIQKILIPELYYLFPIAVFIIYYVPRISINIIWKLFFPTDQKNDSNLDNTKRVFPFVFFDFFSNDSFSIFYYEYTNLIIFFFLCFFLVLIILSLLYFVTKKNITTAKISAYECGFDPFMTTRIKFDISFIIIIIMFLIFDLELIFLILWVLNIYLIGLMGYCLMFFFLLLLMCGFVLEWIRGLLFNLEF